MKKPSIEIVDAAPADAPKLTAERILAMTPKETAGEVDKIRAANEEQEKVNKRALAAYSRSELTDVGNCEGFARAYSEDIRYCFPWKSWVVYTSARWSRDEPNLIETLAKRFVKHMYLTGWSAKDAKLAAWAFRSQARQKIADFLSLARTEPGIPIRPDEFDHDPWLLNLKNGTFELKEDRFRSHRATDFLSKITPIEFDAAALCPLWLGFLDRIMDGNQELIGFLQRAVGYSLSGDTSEQVFFILYGSGMNGKSTFVSTILRLLGEYAIQIRTESLMEQRFDAVPSDIARMKGCRFVSLQETPAGRVLNESLIKGLTGGDMTTARERYADEFQFWPSHKIWLSTNHRPEIRGTDFALWRRVRLVPFDTRISEGDQDKNLSEKLAEELPGILMWALEGCRDWLFKADLRAPAEVLSATESYRSDMDVLESFFSELCKAEGHIMGKDLFAAYRGWAEMNKEQVRSNKWFTNRMRERGFRKEKKTAGVLWLGVSLKEAEV